MDHCFHPPHILFMSMLLTLHHEPHGTRERYPSAPTRARRTRLRHAASVTFPGCIKFKKMDGTEKRRRNRKNEKMKINKEKYTCIHVKILLASAFKKSTVPLARVYDWPSPSTAVQQLGSQRVRLHSWSQWYCSTSYESSKMTTNPVRGWAREIIKHFCF